MEQYVHNLFHDGIMPRQICKHHIQLHVSIEEV